MELERSAGSGACLAAPRRWRALLAALAAAVIALSFGACGSSSGGSGDGVLRATFSSFPDYLDPALSHSEEGWTAIYNTYVPLLTYRHADGKAGSEVIPGLARSLPEISDDGLTYRFRCATDCAIPTARRSSPPTSPGRSNASSCSTPAARRSTPTSSAPPSSRRPSRAASPGSTPTTRAARSRSSWSDRAAPSPRAGAAVHRAAACRDPGRRPLRGPAAGHRPLRDRLLQAGARLGIRPQPALGEEQREG